jgi:hypothetical protein
VTFVWFLPSDVSKSRPALHRQPTQAPQKLGRFHRPNVGQFCPIIKGWAVAHPLAGVRVSPGMVLVYGPRDAAEVEIVAGIAAASHQYATGRAR